MHGAPATRNRRWSREELCHQHTWLEVTLLLHPSRAPDPTLSYGKMDCFLFVVIVVDFCLTAKASGPALTAKATRQNGKPGFEATPKGLFTIYPTGDVIMTSACDPPLPHLVS